MWTRLPKALRRNLLLPRSEYQSIIMAKAHRSIQLPKLHHRLNQCLPPASKKIENTIPDRDVMTLSEMLLADGAQRSAMLTTPTSTGSRAAPLNQSEPGASPMRGTSSRRQDASYGSSSWAIGLGRGSTVDDARGQFKTEVLDGDRTRRRKQAAANEKAAPLQKTRVVEFYRPSALVDNRRVLGEKVRVIRSITDATAAQGATIKSPLLDLGTRESLLRRNESRHL